MKTCAIQVKLKPLFKKIPSQMYSWDLAKMPITVLSHFLTKVRTYRDLEK